MPTSMPRFRTLLLITSAVLILQASIIWRMGAHPLGAVLSKVVQFVLGLMCLLIFARAYLRSTSARRFCWLSLAAATAICVVAQGLEIEVDIVSLHSLDWLNNLLFFASGMPIAMLLFLDTDQGHDRPDWLHFLGLLQVCAFSYCVYLYFSGQALTAVTTLGSAPFGWNTSVVFDGVLASSFALRAALQRTNSVRRLFGPMALYLVAAGLADSYAEAAANLVQDGAWFDVVWTVLLVTPLLICAIWNEDGSAAAIKEPRSQRNIVDQFFPLLYPFCSLLLITQIAERQRVLSSFLIGFIFVTVAVRVLVIQHRLAKTQDALSFEATHDSLTGLPNRGEILRRLQVEMDRQKRTGESFGVLLADADHFKKINDTHGHNVGDEVLREISHRLLASLRPYDSVGRYGGEEFLVVIPACEGPEAIEVAERLRQNIESPVTLTSAGSIPVTI
ncbi:MAG TPA: GGDEF domain-containing protein, partial [Terriglobales bacterium]|nr:GGDEF domain-containing protein [Terriglobales bacterium]